MPIRNHAQGRLFYWLLCCLLWLQSNHHRMFKMTVHSWSRIPLITIQKYVLEQWLDNLAKIVFILHTKSIWRECVNLQGFWTAMAVDVHKLVPTAVGLLCLITCGLQNMVSTNRVLWNMQIFVVKEEQCVSSEEALTLYEHLEETAKTCRSRISISSKLSAWLSMGCMYSHAFICHLLLICRILYLNLALFISHRAVTLSLILKTLHPSSSLCFSVNIWYIEGEDAPIWEKWYKFSCSIEYEPLQPICRFSTSMTPVYSGLFHKGERWNFQFNNNFFFTDVMMSPSQFRLNTLSLDSAEQTSGSSKSVC